MTIPIRKPPFEDSEVTVLEVNAGAKFSLETLNVHFEGSVFARKI